MENKIFSSFRDPNGFLFIKDNTIYRHINNIYKDNYKLLIDSGLYNSLVNEGLLISHKEVSIKYSGLEDHYKTIEPEQLNFISYPYEWCFSQLKRAALATLKIQIKAIEHGMSLKDSSAYNIQFNGSNPLLIDSLSFEKYTEGKPWVAYRQFCQHFLAPLVLMSYKDIRFNQLFRIYIDGIPLDLASSILPMKTYFKFSLVSHIHLHAKSQKYFENKKANTVRSNMSRVSLLGFLDNLYTTIKKLKWKPGGTEWADYYNDTNYTDDSFKHKKQIVNQFLDSINTNYVWDIGANDGAFSRIASNNGIMTISFDIDPAAVEKNYLASIKNNENKILPLLLDLTNPSPAIGWENRERDSLIERGPADTVMALALVHHLAISNNLPFDKIAQFFKNICEKFLVIEFVPKNDSQVQRLLKTRDDIFPNYSKDTFENVFVKYFEVIKSKKVIESNRILYLMAKRTNVKN